MKHASRTLLVCALLGAALALWACGSQTTTGQGVSGTLPQTATTDTASASAAGTASASGGATGQAGTGASGASGEQPAASGSATVGDAGTTVEAGPWKFKVVESEFGDKVGKIQVPRGEVLKIEVALTNGTTKKTTVKNEAFVLDVDGAPVKPATDPADRDSQAKTIGAGKTEDMTLYYILKKRGGDYTLTFTAPDGAGVTAVRVE